MAKNRRVVVTGIGAITPIGLTAKDLWKNLKSGKSGAAEITKFDSSNLNTHFACEVKDFDPLNYFDRKTARRLDEFTQYALAATAEAIEDSGLDPDNMSVEDKETTGVLFGSGMGGMKTFDQQSVQNSKAGPSKISPFFIPMIIPDIAAGQISIKYGFKGPNYCVVSACATANNNMIDAFLVIQQGLANTIITGGTEAPLNEIGVGGFNSARALSTRNDSPETASRPFDATRDGFVMGEGCGTMILEELEHAEKRGANIYGEIIGVGLSADAHHITAPHPDGTGAILSMKMALKTAGIKTDDVDYINMHGTSTPLGDIGETKAIKSLFGDQAYNMNVSSTKSMTGHMLGAAGAIEGIATLLTVQNDIIPPTINFETPDPDCDLNYTFNKVEEKTVNIGMSNAFGFGGHNTTVVFKKYDQ
ncbi:MAG: beta-ketoacyl-ACP synthase II [Ignavibacterium sp.]|nr:MAG: beta-ketoacyl-ACP synthase II [Ignavibacterium sp.]